MEEGVGLLVEMGGRFIKMRRGGEGIVREEGLTFSKEGQRHLTKKKITLKKDKVFALSHRRRDLTKKINNNKLLIEKR